MTTLEINPTFVLKVEPAAVLLKYRAGFWNREPIVKSTIPRIAGLTQVENVSKDPESAIYAIQDRSNNTGLYTTTDHANVQVWRETGDITVAGRCNFCKCDVAPGTGVGYPIRYKPTVRTVDENGTMVYRVFHIYSVTGLFHNYNCALAHLLEVRPNALNVDSILLLRQLYKFINPEAGILMATTPYQLMKESGGSLDLSHLNVNHQYVPTGHVIETPIRQEYYQRSLTRETGAHEIARNYAKPN